VKDEDLRQHYIISVNSTGTVKCPICGTSTWGWMPQQTNLEAYILSLLKKHINKVHRFEEALQEP